MHLDERKRLRGWLRALLVTVLVLAAGGTVNAQHDEDSITDLRALGLTHDSAAALFAHLQSEAGGGRPLSPATMPDWSGLWTRDLSRGITFDPNQQRGELPTARLTPEFHAAMIAKIERAQQGLEYDPISDCSPPGHPRWLTIPFLREFAVTPGTTYLMSEVVNIVRRVYTDGRGHVPEADRYPLWFGDSVGFWHQGGLTIHTNQLRAGQYTRAQPDYTDEVETVEIWYLDDPTTMHVDVWVYDPPALVEPWYVQQHYVRLDNPDRALRARYWHCLENSNNFITETEGGGSTFTDFTFTEDD